MACSQTGNYEQQRQAKKKYKHKIACQFKTRFIAAWEKYGEFQDVNGVRCFAGYRIDGEGEGQERMSWLLKQPDLYNEVDDKHFEWVKLWFNLGKLLTIDDDAVDAFFEHYKELSHNRNADKLHYKLEKVTEPNDYGYYTTDHVVTEHWFEKKIVTVTQDEDGNDVETVTWEKIEDDEYLEELSWELADLALDDAVWFDEETLQEITEIVKDIELTEAELDDMIDGLRATEAFAGSYEGALTTVYKVAPIGDKIEEYTLQQSVGANILDELEYVSYFGDDGTYYLSVEAAKKMRCEVFMDLVIKTIDFRSELKDKYKWRKRLIAIVAIVGAGVALFFGQPEIAASIMASYIGSTTNSKTIKIIAQVVTIYAGGAGAGLSSMSATEALNLILNVAGLYFSLQADNGIPEEEINEDADDTERLFYKMPYTVYDDIYCYDDLIQISVDTTYN